MVLAGLPGWGTVLADLLPPGVRPYATYVYAGGCAIGAIVTGGFVLAGKISDARKKRHEADEAKARADKASAEQERAEGAGPALPANILAAQTLLQGRAISDREERLKLERFVVMFLTVGGVTPTASEASQIGKDVAGLVASDAPEERRAMGLIAEREMREGFALLLKEAREAQAASNAELGERFARIGRLAFFRDVGTAIEAFEAAVQLCPKDVDSRIRLARLLANMNRTAEARAQLENAVAVAERALDRAEARARLAERLFWSGGVAEAAEASTEAIAEARSLIVENAEGHEQLAFALTVAGRVALRQGDSAAAAAYMWAAIDEARALSRASDGAAGRLRLSDTLARASEPVRRAEGLEAAARLSVESIEIARAVAESADAPPEAERTLSVALSFSGDLAASAGEREKAEARFTEALKIFRARAEADPKDSQAQRDVSLSLTRLGDLAASAGEREKAETRFTEALKISRARAEADLKDNEAQRDVSVSLTRLGDLAASAGEREKAETRFTEALKISRARAEADLKDNEAQADVAHSLGRVAELLEARGERAVALENYEEAERIMSAVFAKDPDHAQWRNSRAWYAAGAKRLRELKA